MPTDPIPTAGGRDPLLARLALCNEVIAQVATGDDTETRRRDFVRQCALAARLGYAGLEVAPFTLADDPLGLDAHALAALARIAADHGLAICGLHWLLVAPPGLSLVVDDEGVRRRTSDALCRLVDMAAALGARYLVHGSPKQRNAPAGTPAAETRRRALETLRAPVGLAQTHGLAYCIEPLARAETDFLNTVAQAAAFVEEAASPALRTMIDCSAAGQAEDEPVADLVRRWVPTGRIGHVQLNDPNRRGPGQGAMRFGPILQALRDTGYDGWLAVEPFDYVPDGAGCAAAAIAHLASLHRHPEQP